ncbi:MAG TPA: MFS transporter [Microlunatus sp.]|nr:MFS transporter [Microlunatus sp.]
MITDRPYPHRWRILALTLVVGFMSLLDVTIVNVALPSIQTGLQTGPETIQWIVSGYALTFGLTLVAGGRLGDAHGRRRLLVVGLIGFVTSSAAVGFAPTAELVVAARLVQGAAAGMLTPQSSGLIQQLFRGRERGIAFGYFGTTVSLASATGPVLGGLLIAAFGEDLGWRSIFLVNVPIGIVALILALAWVPKRRERADPAETRLDLVGAVLLGAAVLCVLLPTIEAQGGNRSAMLLLIGAPACGWLFIRWERSIRRRGRPPLLDVALLRDTPGYASGIAVGTVYFTGFTGIFLVLSLFFQQAAGLTALQAGLLVTPWALGGAISSPIAGRLVSRVGRMITVYAMLIMMTGIVGLLVVLPSEPDRLTWWWLLVPLLIAGLGGGGVISPNQTLSLNDVPPRMGGAAGAALQTGQRIGSAFGAALLVTVYHLGGARMNPSGGARLALVCSLAVILVALALAVWDVRRRVNRS